MLNYLVHMSERMPTCSLTSFWIWLIIVVFRFSSKAHNCWKAWLTSFLARLPASSTWLRILSVSSWTFWICSMPVPSLSRTLLFHHLTYGLTVKHDLLVHLCDRRMPFWLGLPRTPDACRTLYTWSTLAFDMSNRRCLVAHSHAHRKLARAALVVVSAHAVVHKPVSPAPLVSPTD